MKKLSSKWFGLSKRATTLYLEQIRIFHEEELAILQKNIADCQLENEELSQEKEKLLSQLEGMYSQRLLELANKRLEEICIYMDKKASVDIEAIQSNLQQNLLAQKNREVEINNEIQLKREQVHHELDHITLVLQDERNNKESTQVIDWNNCLGKKVMTPGKALIGKIAGIVRNKETGIVEGFQLASGLSNNMNFLSVQFIIANRHNELIVSSDWSGPLLSGNCSGNDSEPLRQLPPKPETLGTNSCLDTEETLTQEDLIAKSLELPITADGMELPLPNGMVANFLIKDDLSQSNDVNGQGHTPQVYGGGFWGDDTEAYPITDIILESENPDLNRMADRQQNSEELIASAVELEMNEDSGTFWEDTHYDAETEKEERDITEPVEENALIILEILADNSINKAESIIGADNRAESISGENNIENDQFEKKLSENFTADINSPEINIADSVEKGIVKNSEDLQEEISSGQEQPLGTDDRKYNGTSGELRADIDVVRSKYIIGKLVGADLYDSSGDLIIRRGETITAEVMEKAQLEGKLAELIVQMVIPGLDE